MHYFFVLFLYLSKGLQENAGEKKSRSSDRLQYQKRAAKSLEMDILYRQYRILFYNVGLQSLALLPHVSLATLSRFRPELFLK
jgi:hypothetical protein